MHAKRENKQGENGICRTIILGSYCFLLCEETRWNNSSYRALPEEAGFAVPGRKTILPRRHNLSFLVIIIFS